MGGKSLKTKKSFAYGWGLQGLVALMFFFYAGLSTDGLNVSVPAFVHANGWDYGKLLILSTPAGLIGLLGVYFFSYLADKKGSRCVIVTSLIGSGIVCFLYGHATTMPVYFISICLILFFTNGYGNVATGTLTASWFPRKRGYALGFSSAGMPLSTAIFVPIFAFLVQRLNIDKALSIIGVVVIILGIISYFWVKNTPEEIGLPPDGDDTGLEDLEKMQHLLETHVSKWTAKRLLSNKTVWIQSICYGLLFLTTVGLVSQMIPRLLGLGYEMNFCLSMLSLAAVIGIFGSFVWGIIDLKIGTKKTTLIYAIWYIIAVIVLLISVHNLPGTIFGICMVGWGIGGIGNLQPSMLAQTFGRFDFASASRVITTIVGAIRILAFAIVGGAVGLTGSIDGAYGVLIGANIIAIILAFLLDDSLIGREG